MRNSTQLNPYGTVSKTEGDGSYKLLGMPGRAVVGTQDHSGFYLAGFGFEAFRNWDLDDKGWLKVLGYRCPLRRDDMNSFKEIKIDPDKPEGDVPLDLELDPGLSVRLKLIDPEGKAMTSGIEVTRMASGVFHERLTIVTDETGKSWFKCGHVFKEVYPPGTPLVVGDEILVGGFEPKTSKVLMIRYKKRMLGRVLRVAAEASATAPVVVHLTPLARLKGRIVDVNGLPVAMEPIDLGIEGEGPDPKVDWGFDFTQDDGQFDLEDVPMGLKLRLFGSRPGVSTMSHGREG